MSTEAPGHRIDDQIHTRPSGSAGHERAVPVLGTHGRGGIAVRMVEGTDLEPATPTLNEGRRVEGEMRWRRSQITTRNTVDLLLGVDHQDPTGFPRVG